MLLSFIHDFHLQLHLHISAHLGFNHIERYLHYLPYHGQHDYYDIKSLNT